jgi:predicted alpha/beta-hydrolase family hydrolase
MNEIAARIARAGIRVVRFEFPYMAERRTRGGRRAPDRAAVLFETFREVIAVLGGGPRLVIGGKSMGGRYASMLADDVAARGLLCLGYPFHAPGKRDLPRVEHLQALRTPALIAQGTRDPMGSRDEVLRYPLAASIAVHWLEDGDHSFKPRKQSGRSERQALDEAAEAAVRFIQSL